MNHSPLPIAVIGAGPVGLAAAAQIVTQGKTPIIFEAGATVGAHILKWGHVRLFSPWSYNIDPASAALLETASWTAPNPDAFPTGRELVEQYLMPLAALPQIHPHVRLNSRVVAVARKGFDKLKTNGREQAPFVVTVEAADGNQEHIQVQAVIDASGTYGQPNPLGASGVPAQGEKTLASHIFYGIPDVLGAERERYAAKRVLVVGSGHSAFNAVADLARLAQLVPGTSITWGVRRTSIAHLFGGGERDQLPARGQLGLLVHQLVNDGTIQLHTNIHADALTSTPEGIVVSSSNQQLPAVDEIIVTTGFRPELGFLQELRLRLDIGIECPEALAPLIDPNIHSCGTVRPHGVDELAHPETGVYLVGMKSYGRAPTFLLRTGYEQVRSVVAALVGDWERARNVELVLPETGVCSVSRSAVSVDAPTKRIELVPVGSSLAALPTANTCCSA